MPRSAPRPEDLVAGHDEFDRPPRLAGQQDGERLQVDRRLAPEPATDLGGDHLETRWLPPQDLGGEGPHLEVTLRRAPDDRAAVLIRVGDDGVRLDVALMDGLGCELSLDDDIGLGKARFEIAALVEIARRNIRRCLRRRIDADRVHLGVQHGSIRRHRFIERDRMRKNLIFDFYRRRRLTCGLEDVAATASHGVPLIQHLVAGNDVAGEVVVIDYGPRRPGQHHARAAGNRSR